MRFIGLQEQIRKNNRKSLLLLLSFPTLILVGVYLFFYLLIGGNNLNEVNTQFIYTIPFVLGGVGVWFLIAYLSHSGIIKATSKAKSLSRKEHKRVYNLTENLCMSVGMKMPKLYVINSDALNAFASGIDERSYAVTLTTGIIDKLDDEELEGVIAHELSHIRNKDVRLLIISIIFVGIFAFLVEVLFRSMIHGGRRKNSKVDGRVVLVAMLIAVVVYILSIVFKFALSRKREYLADAGAVEMTKNAGAMASALRKISGNSHVDSVNSGDIKQLFIDNTSDKKSNAFSSISGIFATHPPISKRIAFLEQM